ncbi:MAG: hypothetical protein WD599_03940 [Balneolaceae bacterium]
MATSTAIKLFNLQTDMPGTRKKARIFLAGVGAVGGTLIKQLSRLQHPLYEFEITGACNSTRVLWQEQEDFNDFSPEDLPAGEPKSWESILRKLKSRGDQEHSVIFVDATGSEEVARLYLDLLEAGIHVVTPSKLANTGDQAYFNELQKAASKNGVRYLYETTVGAGLPVIKSIRELLEAGDEIIEISGVVSGTMTYLFDRLENGIAFSKAIVSARGLGYAEPDPRDDLSGEDVARKFLILARTCGLAIDREEVEVESLIPEPLEDVDSTTYLESVSEYDAHWTTRIQNELAENRTLRYVGNLKNGRIKVGIQSVEKKSPLGQLTGTNNLFQIKTGRYFDQPLVIQGPGAGKEVTAAGILSDIQKVINGQ